MTDADTMRRDLLKLAVDFYSSGETIELRRDRIVNVLSFSLTLAIELHLLLGHDEADFRKCVRKSFLLKKKGTFN